MSQVKDLIDQLFPATGASNGSGTRPSRPGGPGGPIRPSGPSAGTVGMIAGALLLVLPGFISSALGLLLLFPPTRYLFRITSIALFAGRFRWAAAGATWSGRAWESWRVRGRDFDIEGEAVEVRAEAIELGPSGSSAPAPMDPDPARGTPPPRDSEGGDDA